MMRISLAAAIAMLVGTGYLPAQDSKRGQSGVRVPDSSVEHPTDIGVRAHTNHLVVTNPQGGLAPGGGMAPSQLWNFYYGLTTSSLSGGHGVIAIVDAYDYPSAWADFNYFSGTFGLPQDPGDGSVFSVVYASGTQPAANSGWSQEAALDIEWAHAMAPNAKIVLVEAASNSFTDLFNAITVARGITGVTHVSMSWGGSEFSGESTFDSYFGGTSTPIFFASSGDSGGKVIYPSASPLVVAVGGTSVNTDSNGAFLGESGWSGSGGGPSRYEAKPGWQTASHTGSTRSVPDVASDADPNTGVSVRWNASWVVFGGTSVSAPCNAGMANFSNGSYANTTLFLTTIYQRQGNFRDITSGKAGRFLCSKGWDYVTGLGASKDLTVYGP